MTYQDSRNLNPSVVSNRMLRLMEEIRPTSWYVVYLIIYRVLYIPGGCLGFLPPPVRLWVSLRFVMSEVPFFNTSTHSTSQRRRSRGSWSQMCITIWSLQVCNRGWKHIVDGRNPKQPPGMFKTLEIMAYLPYQLLSRNSSISSI